MRRTTESIRPMWPSDRSQASRIREATVTVPILATWRAPTTNGPTTSGRSRGGHPR